MQKYFHTPETDAVVRSVYQNPDIYFKKALEVAARRLGWPRFAIKHRAIALGVARTKEAPWSNEELLILDKWAHLHPSGIRRKLLAAGFQRTETGIHLKRRRLQLLSTLGGYSACQLAGLLGIDSHSVARWIEKSWLRAERRGSERTEQQGGDTYFIRHASVFQFLLTHPNEYDLAKVDKLWFLDLITQGKTVWTDSYRPAPEKPPTIRKCLHCGKPLTSLRLKFCSLKCCELHRPPQRRNRKVGGVPVVLPDAGAEKPPLSVPLPGAPGGPISPREQEVFRLLRAGYKSTQIAVQLRISPKTVSTYKISLMKKLGANNDVDLASCS